MDAESAWREGLGLGEGDWRQVRTLFVVVVESALIGCLNLPAMVQFRQLIKYS